MGGKAGLCWVFLTFQFNKMQKLNSIDLAHFLGAEITVKFERQGNTYFGELVGCDTTSITLKNVQGDHASLSEYRVFNEEEFSPILRSLDDMTFEEVEKSETFDRLSGGTREALRTRFYLDSGIDCFGWISKGQAIRFQYNDPA